MVYATWSKGFRPGGINRNGGGKIPPYKPDYLSNYEIGWKTRLDGQQGALERRVLLGKTGRTSNSRTWVPNALTIITNAGSARIKGVETNLDYLVMPGLDAVGRLLRGCEAEVDPDLLRRPDRSAHAHRVRSVDLRDLSHRRARSCPSCPSSKAT